jgi:hypothetical protein
MKPHYITGYRVLSKEKAWVKRNVACYFSIDIVSKTASNVPLIFNPLQPENYHDLHPLRSGENHQRAEESSGFLTIH